MKLSELRRMISGPIAEALDDPYVLVKVNGKWCEVTGIIVTGEHRNAVAINYVEPIDESLTT